MNMKISNDNLAKTLDLILPAIVIIGCLVLIGCNKDGEVKGILAVAVGWLFRAGAQRVNVIKN